jgi:uncharacterized protein YfiM (DUF2279 family)
MKKLIITLGLLLAVSISYGQIAADKKLHFVAGAGVSFVTYAVVLEVTNDTKKAFWYSLGASVLAGVTKELIDEKKYKGFSSKDLLATSLGGLSMSFTINLFDKQQKRNR